MQKLQIGQERQAQENDKQLRQLEEQKALEILRVEFDIDEEDETHAGNWEKVVVSDRRDSWAISVAAKMKTIWAKMENLIKRMATINKMQKMLQPHLSGQRI